MWKWLLYKKTLRAVVTFSISTVTSIKDHKSTANFTCLVSSVSAVLGVLRKSFGKESVLFWRDWKGSIWQSFPLACEYKHALYYNSLNIPQAVDRGIKFSIPKVTLSWNWRGERAGFHCFTTALIELKKMFAYFFLPCFSLASQPPPQVFV